MRPWAMESKIASPVAAVPQPPHANQQRALGVRMKLARLVQQLASGHPREPLPGEHQGDLLTGRRKVIERASASSGDRRQMTR